MSLIHLLGFILYYAAAAYILVMLGRMIFDWVQFFASQWRPRGLFLVIANVIYWFTDPPLRLLRRRIPPLRLGQGVALDVGYIVLFVVVILIQRLGAMLVYL